MKSLLSPEKPADFGANPVRICTCIVYFHDWPRKILILLRAPDLPYYPDMWGFPNGRIEPGEFPREAMVREIYEETGIYIDPSDFRLTSLGRLYARFPDGAEFETHLFTLQLWSMPEIVHSAETVAHAWVTKDEMLERKFVYTNDLCLEHAGYPKFPAPRANEFTRRPLIGSLET